MRRMILLALLCASLTAKTQTVSSNQRAQGSYTLQLPVNEVVLTFHAVDESGASVNDLQAGEIRVWDDGVAPRRIVAFDVLSNRPIRAGILLDTSGSMQPTLPETRAIAERLSEHLLRQQNDEAFVSTFGYASSLIQPWTNNASTIVQRLQGARPSSNSPGGTALFNAVYQACTSLFLNVDPVSTGNFILLFSDGEDTAGLTSAEEAARACQKSNTEVFAFLPVGAQEHASSGPKALRELVARSGGKVLALDDSKEAIRKVLDTIESEVRNQYRLVYEPAEFRSDRAFHQIMMQPPDRVKRIDVRSGYFALAR